MSDDVARVAADVITERQRQIRQDGWSPEHDDEHTSGELAGAAACYVLTGVAHWAAGPAIQQFWPWDDTWWKPQNTRRNLIKAGALILAEIERLDRISVRGLFAMPQQHGGCDPGRDQHGDFLRPDSLAAFHRFTSRLISRQMCHRFPRGSSGAGHIPHRPLTRGYIPH